MSSSENKVPASTSDDVSAMMRRKHWLDDLIEETDVALRVLGGVARSSRPSPACEVENATAPDLLASESKHAAGLMRVNQVGEVCAQALYRAQALVCRDEASRKLLRGAAIEEIDHLVWCNDRLTELKSSPSLLNPVWYAGSFALGLAAARAGVALNLGFMAETERQVEAHLDDHLQRLPLADRRSRAIVAQMKEDEAGHRELAERSGAAPLPGLVKAVMGVMSKCMTTIAYRV